jgi:metal-sulfur cluster biosynthetic enzyme
MGPAIAADAKGKILTLPEIKDANVEVVWEPQWSPAMISAEGKVKLGIA